LNKDYGTVSTLGKYGAEPFVWNLVGCLIIYVLAMWLILGDMCIFKPLKEPLVAQYPANEAEEVKAQREFVEAKLDAMPERRGPLIKVSNLVKMFKK